jgi:hypothetical protein
MEFLPGMQDWLNIWKSINIINISIKQTQKAHGHLNKQKKHLTEFNNISW